VEQEPYKLPIRFYEIDLLRFLAALSVVFFHYTFRGYMEGNYNPLVFPKLAPYTKYGILGVELFFIISGYVILLSTQGKTVRQFFVSRIMRLYPAFWVACSLTFLVTLLWGTKPMDTHMSGYLRPDAIQYIYNMTMLHSFLGITDLDGSYWSLAVEITFYFLISLVLSYKLMRHLDWLLGLWLLLTILPATGKNGTPFASLLIFGYASYFVAGMLFYLMQQPNGRTPLRYALLGASYLLALHSALGKVKALSGFYHSDFSPIATVALITVFFVVFALIAWRKLTLSSPWLGTLGTLTYPLYLIHGHIGYIIFWRLGTFVNKYVLLGATVFLMLGIAYFVHVLVEKRYSKPFGKWLATRLARLDKSNLQRRYESVYTIESK
jgi:peptidoglycan/LPS O-acetylase OafA/YrhL